MNPPFKVGDKVELVEPRSSFSTSAPKGAIGKVIDTEWDSGDLFIRVRFASGFMTGTWRASRFALADGLSPVERKIKRMWERQSYVKRRAVVDSGVNVEAA